VYIGGPSIRVGSVHWLSRESEEFSARSVRARCLKTGGRDCFRQRCEQIRSRIPPRSPPPPFLSVVDTRRVGRNTKQRIASLFGRLGSLPHPKPIVTPKLTLSWKTFPIHYTKNKRLYLKLRHESVFGFKTNEFRCEILRGLIWGLVYVLIFRYTVKICKVALSFSCVRPSFDLSFILRFSENNVRSV